MAQENIQPIEMLNRVEIVGIVYKVAEQAYNNKTIRHITVVETSCGYDTNGQPVMENTWIPVVDVRNNNKNGFVPLEKGDSVHVFGRLRNSGKEYALDVFANRIEKIAEKLSNEVLNK